MEAAIAQLSDVTNGLNARVATLAAARSLSAFEIDFSEDSENFFEDHFSAQSLIATGARTWPVLTLFPVSGNSGPGAKSHLYDGPVQMGADLFISDPRQAPSSDLGRKVRLAIDAMAAAFNDLSTRAYPPEVGYPNAFAWSTETVSDRQGENWLEVVHFGLGFSFDSN
jgi:hypothetical protein